MRSNLIRNIIIGLILVFIATGSVLAYKGTKGTGTNKVPTATKNEGQNKQTPVRQGETTPSPNPTGQPSGSQVSDVKVKALYLTGWTVGSMEKVQHFVDLAKSTEVNAYVVDIKDDDGYVGYESNVPMVREVKAWKKKYDVDRVIKAFHDNNIYLIGRVVCFKDPVLSSKKPQLAIKHSNGGLWRDNHGLTWLSPYNRDSWPYLVAIAKEGVEKGFDEIQFDYIRFANDGAKKAMNFGNQNLKKHEIINEFLAYAKKEMPGVKLSADVFGIICESPGDTEGIGQYLELVGKDIDYISPMVYPSHYAAGQIVNKVKFDKPDLDPYGVIYHSLAKAKERISKVEGYKAGVRPYLQDFTASWLGKGYYQTYGPDQVRQQIKAVYDAGYEEWILWDAGNSYSESALLKE
ncbi:MAG: putative glycoside hydrolase [Clostridia bacterium]|nr:putative glycoside hydrolase [Clostridia bacterium]